MDESWRMRMGTPMAASLPRRRSTERPSANRRIFADSETLDPEDFADVFGGPPRSVFWRKMSGDYAAGGFYEEIFRSPENHNSGEFGGRGTLPAFRIPGTSERFYSDVFGSDGGGDDERRSRERSGTNSKAKSKSTSSSVLSSEEMSPLRPAIGEHVAFSDFASKLRPINVPSRRNSSSTTTTTTNLHSNNNIDHTNISSRRQSNVPTSFYTNNIRQSPYGTDHHHQIQSQILMETEQSSWNFFGKSGHFSFSRRVSSPETISLEPDSYPSVKISLEDAELNSPSSVVSSDICHDHIAINDHVQAKSSGTHDRHHDDHVVDQAQEDDLDDDDDDDDDDDEAMSSYVIEIGSDHREGNCDALGIDEAIAWAKEKFQTHCASQKDNNTTQDENIQSAKIDGEIPNVRDLLEKHMDNNKNGIVQTSPKMEMRVQDENIRLWSVGKEADIRLLLSTLHYILWNNSGWSAIPLTNLIESSQVKKAYQKARLCLHPDKLQQRGATIPQKYVADKAFSILQDAWASFISQDVTFTG